MKASEAGSSRTSGIPALSQDLFRKHPANIYQWSFKDFRQIRICGTCLCIHTSNFGIIFKNPLKQLIEHTSGTVKRYFRITSGRLRKRQNSRALNTARSNQDSRKSPARLTNSAPPDFRLIPELRNLSARRIVYRSENLQQQHAPHFRKSISCELE